MDPSGIQRRENHFGPAASQTCLRVPADKKRRRRMAEMKTWKLSAPQPQNRYRAAFGEVLAMVQHRYWTRWATSKTTRRCT